MENHRDGDTNLIHGRHYYGIFLLSMATLLLELALTRVLSVANWYHFGFLVVSTALLGFGASGVVLTIWAHLRERAAIDGALSVIAITFGIVAMASYWVMQHIPLEPFRLLIDRRQLIFMPIYYLVAAAPFFCSGLAIALLFSRGWRRVNRLYAADLVGAGLGCAVVCVALPLFGGSGSVLVAAMLGFLSAGVFGYAAARRVATTGVILAACVFVLAFYADRIIPISVAASKHHPLEPTAQLPIFTAWNAFSKVDVYRLPAMPTSGRPDPGFSIIIDGGSAGTAMGNLEGGVREYLAHSERYRPTGIAYVGKQHPKVLIIGSGAGREVLEALYFGASSVTAVEINPIINDIVTHRMARSWGGLFSQPQVRLVTEDGRSFVQRSKEKYDVIISIQTMSDAALTSGALSLSETYILTREAFEEYLDHLTPNGVLLVTRPTFQIAKLFATTREVFEQRGLGTPAGHLFSFNGPLAPFGHSLFLTGFLFKKSPFTNDELQTIIERLGVDHPEWWFGNRPEVYYSPMEVAPRSGSIIQQLLYQLVSAPDLGAVYASHRQLMSPATDDRPFFNQTLRWSSLRPYDFRSILSAGKRGNVDAQPVAEVMLTIMLIQTVVIAAVLILLPLMRLSRADVRIFKPIAFLMYFAGLGLGFIMIEIVLLQRFVLFLGQPLYSFAAVLATLLICTGLGSYAANRFRESSPVTLVWIFLALLAILFGTTIVTPWVFSVALGFNLVWRLVIVVALIAPLGMLLGMPFPTGLRIIATRAPGLIPWAWAVNSFFTVVGSIGAMILGMAFGFNAVLEIGAACYMAALLSITATRVVLLSPNKATPTSIANEVPAA